MAALTLHLRAQKTDAIRSPHRMQALERVEAARRPSSDLNQASESITRCLTSEVHELRFSGSVTLSWELLHCCW
jgi:hypothetical protein